MAAATLRTALVALAALLVPAAGAGGDLWPEDGMLTIGVVPQRAYDEKDTEAMADAGIESVRVWFPWSHVESQRGAYQWASLDRTVAENAAGGLNTLPFLFGTPAWAGDADDQLCDGDGCISFAPRSDETRAAFAQFAAAAVQRYGPGGEFWEERRGLPYRPIEVWQIWNEPNLVSFYRPAVDPIAYAAMLEAAAAAIRAEDPDATVLLAGLTGTRSNAKRMSTHAYLSALYSVPNVTASFDGIAVHPYNRKVRGALDQIRAARTVADAAGDSAGVWVTELGWASAGKRRWGLVKSPSGQARLLTVTFERLLEDAGDLGVRAAYWYSWQDTERGKSVCGWCPWSGLLDRIGREKPAYEALRELAR